MRMKLLLILCSPILAFASPAWMFKIKYQESIVIGYGIGFSLEEAKKNALSDIIDSISVDVKSVSNITTHVINGKVKKRVSTNIATNSQLHLSGVKYIKITEEKGRWYVAAKYDNAPFAVRFSKLIHNAKQNEHQNSYLKSTSLIHTLNNEIKYTLNYEIIRKDNLWNVKYKNSILPLNQENFYQLFSTQKGHNLNIRANKEVYKENDEMYFNIQHKTAGFISILYVEHNGKVGVLLQNYSSRKNFRYPNKTSSDIFKISNPYGHTIYELYVAIYTPQKIDLHEFENISDTQLDESNYNFHKLVKLLNTHTYSTYTVKIQ